MFQRDQQKKWVDLANSAPYLLLHRGSIQPPHIGVPLQVAKDIELNVTRTFRGTRTGVNAFLLRFVLRDLPILATLMLTS